MHTQLATQWNTLYLSVYISYAILHLCKKLYCCVKLDKQISFNHIVQMQVNEFRKHSVRKSAPKAVILKIGRNTKSIAGAADVMERVERIYILIIEII